MLFFIKKKIIKTTVSKIAIFDTVVLTFFNDDNYNISLNDIHLHSDKYIKTVSFKIVIAN